MIERLPDWILENWETIFAIIGVPSIWAIIKFAVEWSVRQTPKHKYVKVRKEYLTKINDAYHLIQDGKHFIYELNRDADIIELMRNLDENIRAIRHYYQDYAEALEEFEKFHTALTASWLDASNQWLQYGSAFSTPNFYDTYESISGKLNSLRKQVLDSIPKSKRME